LASTGRSLTGVAGQASLALLTPSLSLSRDGSDVRQGVKATFGSPPLVIVPALMQTISVPSGVLGFGSQASPMSSLSMSLWLGLATVGQLSPRLRKPSPS